jgi:hypothetical protein
LQISGTGIYARMVKDRQGSGFEGPCISW